MLNSLCWQNELDTTQATVRTLQTQVESLEAAVRNLSDERDNLTHELLLNGALPARSVTIFLFNAMRIAGEILRPKSCLYFRRLIERLYKAKSNICRVAFVIDHKTIEYHTKQLHFLCDAHDARHESSLIVWQNAMTYGKLHIRWGERRLFMWYINCKMWFRALK